MKKILNSIITGVDKRIREILKKQNPPQQYMEFGNTAKCHMIYEEAYKLAHPFVSFEGTFIYLYSGTHWEKIDPQVLKVFLRECNQAIEQDRIRGADYKDIDKLMKQFPCTVMGLDVQRVPGKLNFMNGTLDMSTMKLGPHQYDDYFRTVQPFGYDPNANCPLFMKFLGEVLPDKETQMVLSEYIAWTLQPDLKLEKVMVFYGSGRNGKSVMIDIIEALFGSQNVSHESLSDMCGENGANSRSNIVGKMLNTCADVSPKAIEGDIFKRMVSGEAISMKILYKDVITTTDYPKMVFSLNELPKTKDTSGGYYRRFLIIPFKYIIPKKKVDPLLAKKIIGSELPGIMNWVLEGWKRLVRQQAFTQSRVIDKALEDYKRMTGGKKKPQYKLLLPPFYE